MTLTFRAIAVSLVLAVLLAGPLAPVARAQQPAIFEDSMKPISAEKAASDGYPEAYNAGVVAADFFYVPGKVILCSAGIAVGVLLMAVTFGTGYRTAAGFGREGCGGRWVLTGRDLRPTEPGPETFDWVATPSR